MLGLQGVLVIAKRTPLYQRLIGPAYADLPEVTQNIHNVDGELVARGRGRVARNKNALGNWVADRLALPRAASDIPVAVVFEETHDGETISRTYDGQLLTTHQSEGTGHNQGLLEERFGPVRLFIHLEAHEAGIDFHLKKARIGPIPLPALLRPRVMARERSLNGRHNYFVRVGLPFIGMLIEYEGWLVLHKREQDERKTEHIDVV